MKINVDTFSAPKAGNSLEEYEDAAWPAGSVSTTTDKFRSAAADGATASSYSGLWARMLVQAYRMGDFDMYPLPGSLSGLQQQWRDATGNKPLPWYAEERWAAGAFAALVGLTLLDGREGTSGTWNGLAVGDTCLFQIRAEELITAFPLTSSEQFDSSPLLISTNASSNQQLPNAVKAIVGEWHCGDTFYLMSDALACWFLRRWELKADPLELLRQVGNADEFTAFVGRERNDSHEGRPWLKNDDVTWVRCSLV